MISGTRRAIHGIRDTYGDDVVGCRRGRWQREQHEPRTKRRRKLGGGSRATTTTAAQRRSVRLLRLVYVVGVAGIGLLVVGVTSSSAAVHWKETAAATRTTTLKAGASFSSTAGGGGGVASMRGSRGGGGGSTWNNRRWLVTTSSGDEQQEVQEDADVDDATDAACESNAFSGGGAGTVVLLVIAILFTFNGLAIVCDEFFQASLEKISEVLGLTPDVAGATFLAAGSSAPELFTSIADVFGPSNSIGVGTIVGSAMFNVLVIVALSAAVAAKSGASGVIDHRVVARDVSFYTCSIFLLVASASDGQILWWEALLMVLGYGLYIIFMIYNSTILAMCSAPRGTVLPTVGGLELETMEALEQRRGGPQEQQPTKLCTAEAGACGDADSIAATRRRSSVRRGSTGGGGNGGEGGDGAGGEEGGRRGSQLRSRRVSRALRVSHLQERRVSQQGRRASYGVAAGNEGDGGDFMAAAASAAVASVTKKGSTSVRLSWDGKAVRDENARGGGGGGRNEMVVAEYPGAAAVVGRGNASPEAEGEGRNNKAGEETDDRLAWPEGWVQRFLFIFGLPFMVALSLTVPDCSRPQYEKYYILTFVMSITWISIISSYMVELATGAACILGVTPIVMGTLVLAVGTSVPDMIGSMIAAKNGEASMAIANAIGSNVFNILLGLGGPWLFSSLASGVPTEVNSEGATTALIILFCAVMIFLASLMLSRWTMTTKLAYCLLATYAIYVGYTITAEALK